jgi:F420-non-reducing hydrogenase large subunit
MFEEASEGDSQQGIARIAEAALKVRRMGTDLISLAGGQFIHPIKAVVGGMTSGISSSAAVEMRSAVQEMLPIAVELVDYYVETSLAMRERIGTWGDSEPAHYIAALEAMYPNLDGDRIHVIGPDGAVLRTFRASAYREHLIYQDTTYSYAGQTSFEGEVLRANSLARINFVECLGTELADEYLSRFRTAFGRPAHAILYYDLARCIELIYAMERAIAILSDPLDHEDTDVPYSPSDGEGYGLVEAPRGPLIHHYTIRDGLIAAAEFVIPTVHNSLAIERALLVAARRYVNTERVDLELERAVGRVVRAFDPCIACATH